MSATVAIVGGGYAGITAAKALDQVADVVLIDPKDSFVHNVASLRAVVDPWWADWVFFPYERLLERGRVVTDLAVSVESTGVRLASGPRIAADYVVVATGTAYPFPAKPGNDRAKIGRERFHRTAEQLSRAGRVLLLGAGPVGLELAGEIKAAWPDKSVTIVDPGRTVLSGGFIDGFPQDVAARLRDDLWRQLRAMGVEIILNDSLRHSLPVLSGTTAPFTARTWSGRTITADIWFQCFGREPAAHCLSRELSGAWRTDGRLSVGSDLRLAGQPRVFAIGDVTAAPAMDTAVVAMEQGELVAEQIKTLMGGGGRLKRYHPSQPMFLIPLGPRGGASYSPDAGILDAATTVQYKGTDLFVGKYCEIFNMKSPL
ncbi:NADH dehydrogenase FAD-containing subunit [Stackebrandtia albiflava]|uniref:NADH dehydrogenase FAD-containing subunit n=1 Tax=Stackebrandtia albiflava TaxID=406432 RepID=A0A562URK1_9ACTN|nr:FAD-dependent oxidoreductase [Stackebrandtia albiflava]TWJ08243.1 NADH dehydrogenase FAD-containing subunit [Stackebrandtia albiflava]